MAEQANLQLEARRDNQLPAVGSALTHVIADLLDGVVLLDRRWCILYANQAACRISRIMPEDLNSKTHWELYPETLGTTVEETYRSVMKTRRKRIIEAFFYAPFNVWLTIHVLPVDTGIALYYRDVTSEYQGRQRVEESQERLRLALAAANGVGIWDWYVPDDRVYAEAPFAHVFGVDPQAASNGVPFSVFTRNILPEDSESVGSAIQSAMKNGGDFYAEYRLKQADGSICWVAARGRCALDADGAPLRFSGIVVDINDQKRREENLRASQERYRVLAELSPQSLWTADAQGNVLYANQRFLEYIGHDFVPRTGTEYLACFDEADRDRVFDVWSSCVTTGNDYSIEARLLRASDGASRWWLLRAAPVRNDAGKIEQWLGTASDIHEDRLAAGVLQQQYAEIDRQRRELEAIYYSVPIGLALYHPTNLTVLRINNYQANVLRISTGEAVGLRYADLTSGVPSAIGYMRRAAAGETILNVHIEGALDRYPDDYRHWTGTYSPIKNENGEVIAVAVATIEITQQRRSEAALIQSEKLAAVGRMASSIAHEINNPLESVTNLIYIARTYSDVPEVQNFLDLADQELRRVSIIANQTLRFHKQATLPREIQSFDLFTTVLSLYQGRLKNSLITVEKRKRAEHPVTCFEGDIRQVLNNLVANAIDAMPTGGRLLLRSRESTDWRTGRMGIVLTIADTGGGMSAETRARVFEAFYTTKGINGTGLGLWIGSQIVDRHDGRLLLRSAQHRNHHGTVFCLFLPFQSILPNASTLVQ
jgi:PAS domain S-box-containing protein